MGIILNQPAFLSTKREQLVINKPGFALLEVLLASSLFLIIVIFSVSSYLYGEEAAALSGSRQRAVIHADNNLEALYSLREVDFDSLETGGPYYISTSSNPISLIPGELSLNGYLSSISIEKIDDNRLIATSTVTWQQNAQREGVIELVSYLTNWQRFVSANGDWSNPLLESSYGLQTGGLGKDVFILDDYAYIITSGAGPNFFIVDISDASPVVVSSLTLSKNLNKLVVSGSYAYVGGDSSKEQIQIVDILDKANPQLISSYGAPGKRLVMGLDIADNYLYFIFEQSNGRRNQEIFVLDIANINNPNLIFSSDLDYTPSDIEAEGNYLYLSSYNNQQELQIFEILSPSNIKQISSLDLVGLNTADNAISLEFSSSKEIIYISREDGYVYFVDLSDELNPQLINNPALFVSGVASDLKLFNNENYLAVSTNEIDRELKIYDVSDPLFPIEISGLDLVGPDVNFLPKALDYSITHDKLLLVGDGDEQLQVIIPGL